MPQRVYLSTKNNHLLSVYTNLNVGISTGLTPYSLGGYRVIVVYKRPNAERIIFLYAFPKCDKANISNRKEAVFSLVAESYCELNKPSNKNPSLPSESLLLDSLAGLVQMK